jgi:hypothetical protein
MRSKFTKFAAAIAALAALAVGGSAIASAAHKTGTTPPPAQPSTTVAPATDGDNVQQGDQSTPDAPGAAAESAASESSTAAEKPDAAEKPEAAEAPGSEVDANDGPGGHADSSNTADTQQEGTN